MTHAEAAITCMSQVHSRRERTQENPTNDWQVVHMTSGKTSMVSRPTQAIILAGGKGTRLLPLTHSVPKPMIKFNGKPFLEYLIEMLAEQGIERIVLLLGYLADQIQGYFGDGGQWGVEITYSITDEGNDTGRRIKLVEGLVDAPCPPVYPAEYRQPPPRIY